MKFTKLLLWLLLVVSTAAEEVIDYLPRAVDDAFQNNAVQRGKLLMLFRTMQ